MIDLASFAGSEEGSDSKRPTMRSPPVLHPTEDPPEELLCPISKQLMAEPVMDDFGHTYDRRALERALIYKLASPTTNQPYISERCASAADQLHGQVLLGQLPGEHRLRHKQ
eukprot:6911537-Pyramimonas_sp.AAC.1